MGSPRNILIACDKFKGSLSAAEACAAIAKGLRERFPAASILAHPIADGGEGFAVALEGPLSGRWVEMQACDALGRPITARYLLAHNEQGPLAVIEMAETSGIWRILPDERDPMRSSTFGVGEMMRHAVLKHGAKHLVIGLGGSATNDGGAGMAAALGVKFLDAEGSLLSPAPAGLFNKLSQIETHAALSLPPVTAACDVNSPLLGPAGATRVYGPQKGADELMIPRLENVLSEIVRLTTATDLSLVPGAGAAGGLGFGLLHFAQAELMSGFDFLASITGLESRIRNTDLIVTGEGSLDAQSLTGKGPVGVATLARKHGKPVVAFCGMADSAIRASNAFDSITSLADSGFPHETLISHAAEFLEKAALESPIPFDDRSKSANLSKDLFQ